MIYYRRSKGCLMAGDFFMQVSYKKLWKLLIDRDMTRTELRLLSGISSVSLAKLGKDQIVTRNVLAKICTALDCDVADIMTKVPEKKLKKSSGKIEPGQ